VRYTLAGSTAPLAVANYTYDTLPPAARAAVPTDTQLANAAGVALHQLTANPDIVAGAGPGDQPDAAAQPDRKRRPYKAPRPRISTGGSYGNDGAERDQPSPSAVAIVYAGGSPAEQDSSHPRRRAPRHSHLADIEASRRVRDSQRPQSARASFLSGRVAQEDVEPDRPDSSVCFRGSRRQVRTVPEVVRSLGSRILHPSTKHDPPRWMTSADGLR